MSREEFVFSKRAIVVVSVISVIASNVVVGFLAAMWLWNFSSKMQAEVTEAATTAAIAAMQPVFVAQVKHEASDEKTGGAIKVELDEMKRRQDRMEERLNQMPRR